MKLIILFTGLIFFAIGCKQESKSKLSEFELQALGVGENPDSSVRDSSDVEYILTLLAQSKERLAIDISSKAFNILPFRSNGYLSFRNHDQQGNQYYSKYLAYRLSEYIGNVDYDYLYRAYNDFAEISKSISRFDTLCSIEKSYLFYFLADTLKKKEQLDELEKHLIDFPEAKRIKYLLANIYYSRNEHDKAAPIYKDLVKSDYYAFQSLRKLLDISKISGSDSLEYYTKSILDKYPNRCVPEIWNNTSKDSLLLTPNLITECLTGFSQRDSMNTILHLTTIYLNQRRFGKVDSLYSEFKTNNAEFLLDSFKIWEKGEYYDIKLRSLFLQSRYKDLIAFITTTVGYNWKINVGNSLELKKLIKQYYFEYKLGFSESQFETFFASKFAPLVYGIQKRQT